jgi:hypothetical protein
LLVAAVMIGGRAHAQATTTIELTPPSASAFPEVTFFASVLGPDGRPILALPPTSFGVLEDGEQVAEASITEELVGTRSLFIVNTVDPLTRRDQRGVTRFDLVRQALTDAWAAWPDSGPPDDLSLFTADATLVSHQSRSAALTTALDAWPETFVGTDAGYASLLTGLTQALDPVARSGMQTSVVFLTPVLDQPNQQPLEDAVALARTSGATIHAVLIGTPQQAGTAEALRLRQAAETTGGTFRVFDPTEGLEALTPLLAEARTRYSARYVSPANRSGPHSVQLSLETPDLAVTSEPASYSLDVAPPQVTFVRPPTQIVRKTEDPNRPLSDIPPTSVDLPLLITFPDRHTRPIVGLQFLVDGQAVESRTEPPFDSVRWDLTSVVESTAHRLQVEVTDSQGLVARTEILPVDVEVIPGPRGLEALRPGLAPLLAGIAIVGLGIALAAGWVRLGEIENEAGWRDTGAGGVALRSRPRLGALAPEGKPEAFLVPLHADGSPGEPIPLQGGDLTIGTDAALCGLLLDDPSASGLHARLTRRAAGSFLLRDQSSVSGTWVNESPVGDAGVELNHGDRIYFGRAAFRFRLATPGPQPRVSVLPARGGIAS